MTMLDTITQKITYQRTQYTRLSGQLYQLQTDLAAKQQSLQITNDNITLWQQTQLLLSKSSEFARAQLKTRVEETVTAALQAVFGDDTMRFKIDITTQGAGGKPSAEWRVESAFGNKDGSEPEANNGGGVVDIISLALRLVLLELSRPKPGGPILLDEPGKQVSKDLLPNLALFIKEYARKTGRQILMISHHEPLAEAADKSYYVELNDVGVSEVKEVERSAM